MDEITTLEASKILKCSTRHVLWYGKNGYLTVRWLDKRTPLFNRKEVETLEKPKRTGRPPKNAAKKAAKDKPAPEAKGKKGGA